MSGCGGGSRRGTQVVCRALSSRWLGVQACSTGMQPSSGDEQSVALPGKVTGEHGGVRWLLFKTGENPLSTPIEEVGPAKWSRPTRDRFLSTRAASLPAPMVMHPLGFGYGQSHTSALVPSPCSPTPSADTFEERGTAPSLYPPFDLQVEAPHSAPRTTPAHSRPLYLDRRETSLRWPVCSSSATLTRPSHSLNPADRHPGRTEMRPCCSPNRHG